MGCGSSAALDRVLAKDHESEKKVIKLLLLGTGESGKSTIFKQMQIIYDKGFGDAEKQAFRKIIRRNAVDTIQNLLLGVEKFDFHYDSQASVDAMEYMMGVDTMDEDFWEAKTAECAKTLWLDPVTQEVFTRRAQLQILDSAGYMFDNLDRIAQEVYVPTEADILHARLRTSGIVEKDFVINENLFKFLDVGGQRNERRKWIHCFENVTCIIFVAAISEFDQRLAEDESQNRLVEAIRIFEEIFNQFAFTDTGIILFLNKTDIFREKLQRVPLSDFWPDYHGDNSFDDAAKFLEQKFLEQTKNDQGKLVFPYLTCATDTGNVQKVFDACKIVILKKNLTSLGLS